MSDERTKADLEMEEMLRARAAGDESENHDEEETEQVSNIPQSRSRGSDSDRVLRFLPESTETTKSQGLDDKQDTNDDGNLTLPRPRPPLPPLPEQLDPYRPFASIAATTAALRAIIPGPQPGAFATPGPGASQSTDNAPEMRLEDEEEQQQELSTEGDVTPPDLIQAVLVTDESRHLSPEEGSGGKLVEGEEENGNDQNQEEMVVQARDVQLRDLLRNRRMQMFLGLALCLFLAVMVGSFLAILFAATGLGDGGSPTPAPTPRRMCFDPPYPAPTRSRRSATGQRREQEASSSQAPATPHPAFSKIRNMTAKSGFIKNMTAKSGFILELETATPLKHSLLNKTEIWSFERLMESCTALFIMNNHFVELVETYCSLLDQKGRVNQASNDAKDIETLTISFRMVYSSRYLDVSTYPEEFLQFVSTEAEKFTADVMELSKLRNVTFRAIGHLVQATETPSEAPSVMPFGQPSLFPTEYLSESPTFQPSSNPTLSWSPTQVPSSC